MLIIDNKIPTNNWLKATVKEVYPGEDRKIRVVYLRTKAWVFRRPVSKLYPVDCLEAGNR